MNFFFFLSHTQPFCPLRGKLWTKSAGLSRPQLTLCFRRDEEPSRRRKDTMLNYTNARTTLVPKILRNFDRVIPERCVSSIEECLHRVDFNSRWTNYGGLLKFAAKCGATVKRLTSRKSSLENVPSGKSWNDPSNEIHEFSTMNA